MTHARTHARTHAHGANYNLPPASRAGDKKQEGHRCPKRRVAQAAIRLATAVTRQKFLYTKTKHPYSF